MRHQSIRQTDGYTDEAQLPIYDSIKNLPRLNFGKYTTVIPFSGAAMSKTIADTGDWGF